MFLCLKFTQRPINDGSLNHGPNLTALRPSLDLQSSEYVNP